MSTDFFVADPSQLTTPAAKALDKWISLANFPAEVVGVSARKPYIDKGLALMSDNVVLRFPFHDGVTQPQTVIGKANVEKVSVGLASLGSVSRGFKNISVHPTGPHTAIGTFVSSNFYPDVNMEVVSPFVMQARIDPTSGLITEMQAVWNITLTNAALAKKGTSVKDVAENVVPHGIK